jgi:hypothetical protein
MSAPDPRSSRPPEICRSSAESPSSVGVPCARKTRRTSYEGEGEREGSRESAKASSDRDKAVGSTHPSDDMKVTNGLSEREGEGCPDSKDVSSKTKDTRGTKSVSKRKRQAGLQSGFVEHKVRRSPLQASPARTRPPSPTPCKKRRRTSCVRSRSRLGRTKGSWKKKRSRFGRGLYWRPALYSRDSVRYDGL